MAAKAKKEDDADDTDGAEGESEQQPKRRISLKLVLIAAGAVLVLGAGGTAAFLMLHGQKEEQHAAMPVKPPAFFDLPEVLVNLSNVGSDRTQYLKAKIVLELPDQAVAAQIQPVLPRVVDAFQTYLRELRATDLEGSAGLYRMRDELTRRINVAIAPNHINAVLFKEIVVQ